MEKKLGLVFFSVNYFWFTLSGNVSFWEIQNVLSIFHHHAHDPVIQLLSALCVLHRHGMMDTTNTNMPGASLWQLVFLGFRLKHVWLFIFIVIYSRRNNFSSNDKHRVHWPVQVRFWCADKARFKINKSCSFDQRVVGSHIFFWRVEFFCCSSTGRPLLFYLMAVPLFYIFICPTSTSTYSVCTVRERRTLDL